MTKKHKNTVSIVRGKQKRLNITNEVTDKKDKDREEMMGYVRELEGYVNDMENYLNKEALNKISPPDSESFSSHLDSLSSQVTRLLKEKNKSYGNTALNPPNMLQVRFY